MMKSKVLFIFLLLQLSFKIGFSQHTYANWSKHFDGHEPSAFNNILFDGQTIICNGYWTLNADFEGITLPTSTSSNALLTKMDLEGNVIWHTTMVGEGYENFFDMTLDNDKNIIAVGFSTSNEPVYINDELVYQPNMEWTTRGVVAKFSGTDGSLVWYKPIIPNDEYYNLITSRVAVDAENNIYITGYTNVSFEMDGFEFEYSQEGWGALTYMAKLNSDGETQWGRCFNFVSEGESGWSFPRSLITNTDDVYLALHYSKPMNLDEIILPFEGDGSNDWIALVKISASNAEVLNATAYGSASNQNIAQLKFDSKGSIIATGYFESESDFNINGQRPITYGYDDAYVAKFNSNFELQWLRSMGSEFDSRAFNLSITENDRIFIGGGFDSYTPFYFQGHKVIEMQSPNSLGMFQVIIDGDGEFEKAFALYGQGISSIVEYNNSVVLDNDIVMAIGASIDYVDFIEGNTFYSDHTAGFLLQWDLSKNFYKVLFNIKDADGNTLENAIVTLGNTTNAAGSYSFYQIDDGTYTYSISLSGYNTVEGELVVAGSNVTQNIELTQSGTSISSVQMPVVSVYPNPAKGNFIVNSNSEIVGVRVIDALGSVVFSMNVNSNNVRVNTETLQRGLYIVVVSTKTGTTNQRIVID